MGHVLMKSHRLLLSNFLMSFLLTGLFIYLGHRFGWLERHDKLHPKRRVVSYGGLVIYATYWLNSWRFLGDLWSYPTQRMVFISSTLLVIIGLIDDYFELSALVKAIGILICSNIIFFGTDLHFASNLISIDWSWGTGFKYLLTISWIFIVTNSINLLDGVDGLASSVSVSGLIVLAITSYSFSLSLRYTNLILLLLLVTSILGFIPWNWSPAKIYLGDTGALFIGFMYAIQSITNLKNIGFYTIILPVIFYLVPLFDTAYVIVRRYLNKQSILSRDESHLHYSLRRYGLSDTQIVLVMVAITAICSLLGLLSQVFAPYRHWITLVILMAAGFIFLWLLSKNLRQDKAS